jgi:hypothetical protein
MLGRLGHAMVTPASRGQRQICLTQQRSHPAMSFITLPAGTCCVRRCAGPCTAWLTCIIYGLMGLLLLLLHSLMPWSLGHAILRY